MIDVSCATIHIPALCDTLDDYPELSEHLAYVWIRADKLDGVDLCEADMLVAAEYRKRFAPGPREKQAQ